MGGIPARWGLNRIKRGLRAGTGLPTLGRAMEEPRTEIARRIFAFWQSATGHKRGRLDDKRMKIICSRLSDGYTEDDLKLAAFGCAHSRFHQGENDRHQVYDSVELIYRNADQVDKFIRLGEQEHERVNREIELKRAAEETRIALSTTGDKYKQARATLLSIVRKREPGEDEVEAA